MQSGGDVMAPAATEAGGPLAGIRVIEMGQLIAGPFCGQLLGDFGAEVIKVEPPGSGDPMRQWGSDAADGDSLWFAVIGRNKKSITLDLRRPEGQEVARRLIAKADILVENFRPGTMERWGLGYEPLSGINPGLIMVRVTGYGQTGPYAHRAGFGSIGEAMGGLRYVVGDPATPPSRMGISIGDSLAATHAALGACMALQARHRTGRGQVVDAAIYEAVLAMMESLVTDYDQTGTIRERTGAILPNIAPSNVYPTRDGQMLVMGANQDSVFRRLCEAMGMPGLADDARYRTHAARGQNQAALDALIAGWTRGLDVCELERIMDRNGIPAGRMYRAPEMLDDPHFRARQAIVRVAHPRAGVEGARPRDDVQGARPRDDVRCARPRAGQLAMQNVMPRLSETPGAVRHAGPALGEHTDAILSGLLGMAAVEIAALREAGVL